MSRSQQNDPNLAADPSVPLERRWAPIGLSAGIEADSPLVVALSGGADSVLLLHLIARAKPRPPVLAVHVNHGLRGAESEADAEFCRDLCDGLDVPFELRTVGLDASAPGLEARARAARYEALLQSARAIGDSAAPPTLVTGHHADDVLETLLMRWPRGTALGGLTGPSPRTTLKTPVAPGERPGGSLDVVRPLIHMRREEVRSLLLANGLTWREDSSNRDARFTRNRVRGGLLPQLEQLCGPEALDHLRAFGDAVQGLESQLADATAHLAWEPLPAAPSDESDSAGRGGEIPRRSLASLPLALQRRALQRLLAEGPGERPRRPLLDRILEDLGAGRNARHTIAAAWSLVLRGDVIQLLPPAAPAAELEPVALAVPGVVPLPDGRELRARWIRSEAEVSCEPDVVELDVGERTAFTVRTPRPGDRFRALGSPGSRALGRFLADAGVPREARAGIPLVVSNDEILWVAGVRPAESARSTGPGRRLELRLATPRGSDWLVPRPPGLGRGRAS